MIATFNIKVNIDNNNVTTDFNCEKIEKFDTVLLAQVLKVFGDIQSRISTQINKFSSTAKNQSETPAEQEQEQVTEPENPESAE